ncbi:MAG: isocitrate/isopropylmalate family dehydrogenase, partial [Candidatus Marinimicrobia bacterium]|nr:isocitrate/isopropylmalate family dehydrogenase [Candidatus Neomarinimicrobiota bacterium]
MGSEADSIWLGPITNQSKLKAYNRNKIVQKICSNQGFEFFYRHFKPLASLQKIQSDNPIDVLLIENNFYSHTVASELPASFVSEKKLDVMTTYYSQNHLESIFTEAERLLKAGIRHKLLIILPDELRQSDSPWIKPASQLADLGYNVQWSSVDQFFYNILRTPDQLDLVLTVSPFGRIFSKLVSAIEGGLGTAYEFHRSTNNKSFFHVLHPASRRFVGKDAGNPIGAILSIAEFMNGQNKPSISKAIRDTVEKAINAGWVTRDLGGSMGTIEMGDFICSKLSENIAKS